MALGFVAIWLGPTSQGGQLQHDRVEGVSQIDLSHDAKHLLPHLNGPLDFPFAPLLLRDVPQHDGENDGALHL